MKKNELTKVIEVLEREDVSEDFIEILRGIMQNKASDEVNLINRCDYFATILWQEEDVVSALEKNDIKVTDERISAVMSEAEGVLEDCSHGWEVLDTVIGNLFDDECEEGDVA